jgi:ribosome maturation factor RimP
MSEIVNKVRPIIEKCAEKLNIEIVDIEWVKEHGSYILRILADTEYGLTIDDSVALNEAVSLALDQETFVHEELIQNEYMLEVSSPGLERPIKGEKEITKAIGSYINIKTYEKIEAQKEFEGYLRAFDGNLLEIEVNVKGRLKTFKIEKNKISTIRYAVEF